MFYVSGFAAAAVVRLCLQSVVSSERKGNSDGGLVA